MPSHWRVYMRAKDAPKGSLWREFGKDYPTLPSAQQVRDEYADMWPHWQYTIRKHNGPGVPPSINVWEHRPSDDKLVQHRLRVNDLALTVCSVHPWSPETDAAIDPDGTVVEDVWFSEHERDPNDIALCEKGCYR